MPLLKPLVLLLVVFAAGVCAGVVGNRYSVRQTVHEATQQTDILQLRIEREMVTRLALDPAQEAKVREIVASARRQAFALRAEIRPQMRRVLADAQKQLSDVLTPEQRKRLVELRADRDETLRSGEGSFPLLERWRSRRENTP